MDEHSIHGNAGTVSQLLGGSGQMPDTLWTLVLSARDLQVPDARAAMATLNRSGGTAVFARMAHRETQSPQALVESKVGSRALDSVSLQPGSKPAMPG